MAKTIILLDKEDIQTTLMGCHLEVVTDIVTINLTLEAARELNSDLSGIIKMIDEIGIDKSTEELRKLL